MPAGKQTRQASAAEMATILGNTVPPTRQAPEATSRFKLLGVVTQGSGGAALLAIDGQPAKVYPVGSHLDKNTVLQEIGLQHVILSSGATGDAGHKLSLTSN